MMTSTNGKLMARLLGLVKTAAMSLVLVGLNCAPTPASYSDHYALGPEVLVSINEDGGELRCEPSAAMFKDVIVIAWNDSYGGMHDASTGTAIGWSISKDHGRTFSFGGYLPRGDANFATSGADSRLAVDERGDFFLEL